MRKGWAWWERGPRQRWGLEGVLPRAREGRAGELVKESLVGSCHEAWSALRGLGKTQFKDPPVRTCLDLSLRSSGTSPGRSSWKRMSTRWEQVLERSVCPPGGSSPSAALSCFNLLLPRLPTSAPLCVASCEVGVVLREGPPIRTE